MTNSTLTGLLASYVPKLIQKRVIDDPTPIESPVAEDFPAAVLFADISGFTRLTERLAEQGPGGVETLARILNEYFGELIEIAHAYGGDVVKFAGDAVIAIWPLEAGVSKSDEDVILQKMTVHAAECALKIRQRLLNYKIEDLHLYLKLAVSAGRIGHVHVGGVFNRWEFLLTGTPLFELGIANTLAKAGDVLLTPSAWEIIESDCIAEPVEFGMKSKTAPGGRLTALKVRSSYEKQEDDAVIPDEAQTSLRAYIPGAIINRLSAGHMGWIAELRRVTVLFINLPDITYETTLEEAQSIARLLQRSVYRYEGSINKINVDDKGITVVAAMGLPPFAHEDDPVRGVNAAMMIRKELLNLNVRSHIGITTGRIFCGSIGNNTRREYTIIGNAVNMSARLMGAAATFQEMVETYDIPIFCDRATHDSAKGVIEFDPLPPQVVKGRSEAMEVFRPIGKKEGIIRPSMELIGRQEEKTLLANALQELSRGSPLQVIIFHGEAGIGKSRLMEELIRQARTLNIRSYVGAADSIERGNPYHAWRPIFNKLFQIEETLAHSQFDEEQRRVVQEHVLVKLAEVDADLVRYAPLLDVVLPSVFPENEFTASMTGEIRGGNIRELLIRLFKHETAQAPLLIVIEDLHWLDSSSWALLTDIHRQVRPILLALNTRPLPTTVPDEFKAIADAPDTKFVKLDAMLLDDVEALVCQRLGVKTIPPQIGKLIREKSEGHPFFAEELAYALRDTGVLVIRDQECSLSERFPNLEAITLPETLQAAITNRIDSLNPSQQLTLKVASVIGRIFAFRMLHAIHPIETDKSSLNTYMDTLTRMSLTLVESAAPDLSYIFKHAVTQEVAYNLMLYSQRSLLHQAVAEWIERSYEKDIEAYYPLLAHHWSQAAESTNVAQLNTLTLRAIDYLEKAGEQAMQNFANQEAIQFFSQALELDGKLPQPEGKEAQWEQKIRNARWHSRLGLAHYGLGSLPDCEIHIRKALRMLDDPLPESNSQFIFGLLNQVARQALHRFFPSWYVGRIADAKERQVVIETGRLYELMARIYFYSNETVPIMYVILHFLNTVERADASPELAAAYSSMAVLAGFAQLHSLAEMYVERGLVVAREVNQPANIATVSVVTGAYKITVGKWDEVRALVEEGKTICEQLGDYRQWGDCAAMLGENALLSGDIQYSMNIQRILLADARRRHSPLHQCWGLLGVAANNIRMGNVEEALPMLEEALKILEETPNLASQIEIVGQLALAYIRLGQEEKAREYAVEVLDLMGNTSPTVYSMGVGFAAAAEALLTLWEKSLQQPDRGTDPASMKKLAERSIKLMRAFQSVFPIGKPQTEYFEGWHAAISGNPQKAVKLWRKSLKSAQKFQMPHEEALARVRLGSASTTETMEERRKHFCVAIEIFEKMPAPHELNMALEGAQKAGFQFSTEKK
jgi:class 3 adenylate cyclase/tetratricopeptide (TPR) repeat protein